MNLFKLLFVVVILGGVGSCGAKKEHKIAKIDEASGVSFCKNSKTLFVVGDEGDLYEVSLEGKILSKHHLGDFDLEGVVCGDDEVVLAEESGYLIVVDRKSFRLKKLPISGKEFKFSKKAGIEGLVKIDKDRYVASIQSKKKRKSKLLILELKNNRAKIKKIINHGVIDSAGLEYRDGKLYIVSDKKDKLYIYDLKDKKVIKKIDLPKFAQEGVAFGEGDSLYFADDDGALFKFSQKELGIIQKK